MSLLSINPESGRAAVIDRVPGTDMQLNLYINLLGKYYLCPSCIEEEIKAQRTQETLTSHTMVSSRAKI